jgi:Fic family protein
VIFQPTSLGDTGARVLDEIHSIRERIKFSLRAPARWLGLLRRSTFARAVRASNSIEGYIVTAEDALAAVEGEAPMESEGETWNAVKGYRDAMTYVLQLADDPHFSYSDGLLKSLHFMMMQHELRKHPGTWRAGAIYVRDEQRGEIVHEGADAGMVPALIGEMVAVLNASDNSSPAMIRAAMGHLNLVMIHPFSDGNGRMARCLQTLVLAREGILEPQFCSIEEYLGRNTREYYEVLAAVGKGGWHPENDVRPWIRFCLTAHYRQAKTLVRRIEETRRIWDEVEALVQARKLPERCITALVDAASGYRVRNSTYRSGADISDHLASRDFKTLVDCELLLPSGERRGRTYVAAGVLVGIRNRIRQHARVEDPFDANPGQSLLAGL